MSIFAERRSTVVTLYPGNFQSELNVLMEQALAELRKEESGETPRRASTKSKANALALEYDKKLSEAEAAGVGVTLREVSNMEWEQLSEAHPPRDDDDFDQRAGFNRPAFQRALVQASINDPTIDLDTMSRAHFMKLADAVTELHGADDSLPKAGLVSLLKQYRESGSKQQPDGA